MSGVNTINSLGIYGTITVPAIANFPAGRAETCASWTDAAGDLWLFGGAGQQGIQIRYNDMWKYNIATNQWTWMKGPSTFNDPGNYGTMGVTAATNNPPSKWIYAKWKDLNNNLWMGQGLVGLGNVGTLWKYDITTNNWTWMKGSNTLNSAGVIGAACVASNTLDIPSRLENRTAWTDTCGNFWTFGGISNSVYMNDLWHYNVQSNEWTMVHNVGAANNGTILVPAATNRPRGRFGAIPFKDNNDNLWMFGGESGAGVLNDVWKFVIDTNCVGGCS